MFLKQLFGYNKFLCFGLLSFIAIFYFINYKRQAVIAPIFQYGMYSRVMHLSDTQEVIHLYVNDKKVDLSAFDFAQRDNLLETVSKYKKSKEFNIKLYLILKASFNRIALNNLIKEKNFTNNLSDEQFMHWYKDYVADIIGYKVNKMAIYLQSYIWQSNSFLPAKSPEKLFSFGIE